MTRAVFRLQLSDSPDASEMAAVLRTAFQAVSRDLQGALQRGRGQLEDAVQVGVLLDKYSEQLVQMTREKLSRL